MCSFVWCVIWRDMCIFVSCLIVVTLPPAKNPFAVQINNNNIASFGVHLW
jgi:hypothetical protein